MSVHYHQYLVRRAFRAACCCFPAANAGRCFPWLVVFVVVAALLRKCFFVADRPRIILCRGSADCSALCIPTTSALIHAPSLLDRVTSVILLGGSLREADSVQRLSCSVALSLRLRRCCAASSKRASCCACFCFSINSACFFCRSTAAWEEVEEA